MVHYKDVARPENNALEYYYATEKAGELTLFKALIYIAINYIECSHALSRI